MKLDEITIPAPQELIALPPAKRAAVALKSEAAEAHLRDLVAKTSAITNVVDKNGREEAHRAAMTLKNARVAIKNIGEEAREDAVAFQRAVVAEVARLAAITTEEETRLFALRDAFDAKVAAEKAERERIEAERVAAIRAKIDLIAALPVKHAGDSVTQLNAALLDLANRKTDAEEFFEFTAEAIAAVNATGQALVTMRNAAAVREQEEIERQRLAAEEQKRIAEERAELARLKAEQAERDRVAAAEAAERERLAQVEREKAEAERKAAADREADLQRQLAEMRAMMEAAQRAAQPQPEVTASPTAPMVEVPLVTEGDPVTLGVDLAAPDGDVTAEWIGSLPGMADTKPEPINSAGQYYSTTTFRDDGKPILCNADGTRSIFCDVDQGGRPDNGEILDVLAAHYGESPATVLGWLHILVKEVTL